MHVVAGEVRLDPPPPPASHMTAPGAYSIYVTASSGKLARNRVIAGGSTIRLLRPGLSFGLGRMQSEDACLSTRKARFGVALRGTTSREMQHLSGLLIDTGIRASVHEGHLPHCSWRVHAGAGQAFEEFSLQNSLVIGVDRMYRTSSPCDGRTEERGTLPGLAARLACETPISCLPSALLTWSSQPGEPPHNTWRHSGPWRPPERGSFRRKVRRWVVRLAE
jgi:hypothetical protein